MKKLIYLIASILFALTSVYGVYDIFVTKQDDLMAGIMAVLFAAFLAWLFMHLFLKPEPRHKHQAANMPESSSEAASDALTVETAQSPTSMRIVAWRTITWLWILRLPA